MSGKLFVVGTPIGNLYDMSPRATETLTDVDFIAAEDTRVTLKLLNHFGIKTPLISYFEHNKLERGEEIINRILKGESVALVTDAGMPAISDPGEDLVRTARESGIEIEAVPGPTAVTTALAISGLPTKKFRFEGFLPAENKERKEALSKLSAESETIVLYEAPHRLQKTLGDLYAAFGERKIALCKEITKIHENVNILTLSEAVKFYEENLPKGEFVLIIEGAKDEGNAYIKEEAVALAKEFINDGMKPSAAAKWAAKIKGGKKNDIYKELI